MCMAETRKLWKRNKTKVIGFLIIMFNYSWLRIKKDTHQNMEAVCLMSKKSIIDLKVRS